MAPRKRKQNADEKALPEVTAAERAAVEKYRAKKKPEPNAAKPYDKRTSQERTAINKFLARNAANPAPRLKVLKGQAATISPDHPDRLAGQMLLMDALGTGDLDFYHGLLNQLATAGSKGGQVDERGLNFMLSVMKGVQPRDQLEAMLAGRLERFRRFGAYAQVLVLDSEGGPVLSSRGGHAPPFLGSALARGRGLGRREAVMPDQKLISGNQPEEQRNDEDDERNGEHGRLPDLLHAPPIFAQIRIAKPGSRANMNDRPGSIHEKLGIINK